MREAFNVISQPLVLDDRGLESLRDRHIDARGAKLGHHFRHTAHLVPVEVGRFQPRPEVDGVANFVDREALLRQRCLELEILPELCDGDLRLRTRVTEIDNGPKILQRIALLEPHQPILLGEECDRFID